MSLLGPYKIIGEIYSSGWWSLKETFENNVTLRPILKPDIILGTITIDDEEHDIVYNQFELAQHGALHYRLVYIPKEGFTTTILLYFHNGEHKDMISKENNTFTCTRVVRDDETDINKDMHIRLILSESAVNKLLA
jgi:hypothetical protein